MDRLELGICGAAFAVYVIGVLWGLIVIDERPPGRVVPALLWPLGPIAFVMTVAALLAASLVAYPAVAAAALVAGGLAWWALGP